MGLPRFEEGFQHTADAASYAQIPGGLACRFSSSSCMKALDEIGLPWERLSNQSAEYHAPVQVSLTSARGALYLACGLSVSDLQSGPLLRTVTTNSPAVVND